MNSSEEDESIARDVRNTPLIRLLQAMAQEWLSIAEDVEALGAKVSDAATTNDIGVIVRDFQQFDLIHQRAQGQANLVTRLTRKIADDQIFDRKRFGELIDGIPFHAVRVSFQSAFEGEAPAAGIDDGDNEIDWL